MSNTVIKFAVDKIDFIDDVNDSLFRRARIHAFATGRNAHTLPIDEDVLKRGAETIYNKPILWKYDKFLDDAMGHEKDEVPCGFVPKENNPITFEKSDDGRIFIVINALIWTKYSGKLIEIFQRDDNKKDVSIEIVILDADNSGEKPKILDFIIAGITILGEWVNPACKGCKAELLAFSEDKEKYEEQYYASAISIDNSADSAVSGQWHNPRNKLLKPLLNASNAASLLKEAYLINDGFENDLSLSAHKYPHHVISNGRLVVHKDGVIAAFQRASQQGIATGAVRSHLLKHYKELGLDIGNFSECDFKESEGGQTLNNTEILETKEFSDMNVEAVAQEQALEKENEEHIQIAEEAEKPAEEVVEEVTESKEEEVMAEEPATSEEDLDKESAEKNEEVITESVEGESQMSDCECEHGCEHEEEGHEEEEETFESLKVKFAALEEDLKKTQADNEAYMSQIAAMSDYEELKKFKADAEAKAKQEAEMAQMNQVMSDIESRGIQMSENDKAELFAKFSEFESIDAWANFAKAQVFDKAENIEGVIKMGLPYSSKRSSGSIWDRI